MRASEGAVNSRVYSSEEKDLVSIKNEVEKSLNGDAISYLQNGT